ncbi:hypothetical protein AArc1_3387 [Natrarchaeobaculum sulfurireducens]|uniref:Uncharacterized protein n=2 Tax=Natrarchaeobaculum sulfurireducens TaxID=2044521 RepID=A0A346PJI5_9EURY|nr:hypothetical protein AArc1_3387 [Natrarchaeobaculum sulfurireducens]
MTASMETRAFDACSHADHLEESTAVPGSLAVDGWLSPTMAPVLIGIILLAAFGTAILFFAGIVGYHRRRTIRHGIIAIALGLLVARSLVGLGTVFGLVPMVAHHIIEHGFDLLIAALLLYLLYEHTGSSDPSSRLRDRGNR